MGAGDRMQMKSAKYRRVLTAGMCASAVVMFLAPARAVDAQAPNGPAIFARRCLLCHGPGGRGPQLSAMKKLKSDAVYSILTDGIMQAQANGLTEAERHAVADYVGAKKTASAASAVAPACAQGNWSPQPAADWNGWSPDVANTRFQPAAALSPADVPNLKLKWAMVFPDAASASNPATVVGGRVFIGSWDGTIYALDAQTGCTYWTFSADSGVRTAIAIAGDRAFFGDFLANAYALDARTGKLIWKTKVDTHPYARITGSPVAYQGRLYVPMSSLEEGVAGDASYVCCTFRGSLAALDAASGTQVWKSPTIDEPLKKLGSNKNGVDRVGPAGAAVWSAPTIDSKRGVVYVTTGNNYSGSDAAATDAVIAFDLATGKRTWLRSLRPNDQWNASCLGDKTNCPEDEGPDFDFGASAMVVHLPNGHDAVLAGQKSGVLYALDPDKKGATMWEIRLGKGNALGGIEWGMAADEKKAYVAIADWDLTHPAVAEGALTSVDLASGKLAWRVANPADTCKGRPDTCSSAMAAAVAVVPGIVFEGSVDGFLRAYDPNTGKLLWEYDTAREVKGVNGIAGHGGSVNGAGATVSGGLVFQTTGYAAYGLGMPGNVLLVFGADSGKTSEKTGN